MSVSATKATPEKSILSHTCPISLRTQKCVLVGGLLHVVSLLIAYCIYNYFRPVPSAVLHTKWGDVQGIVGWSRNGNEFSQYLGIPFAQPPIGDLRFEPPEPALPWEGVWDASYYRPKCLQVESFVTGFIFGEESCLFLNIFVSKVGKSSGKSVMVYIHGGLFHVGGSDFAGPRYIMDEDIILITINYRLGVFGFLSTGDDVISGNMGLKDQNMALRWIQENIEYFGGNKNAVTIFGESAGGASVHHHLLSPASRGLFHKAIHQSGSSHNYWAVYRNVKEQSRRLAAKFNCPITTSKDVATCLKALDPTVLVTAHRELMDLVFRPQITTFVPTIETQNAKNPFIVDEPKELLATGKFTKVPLMTGINSNEGQLISKTIVTNQTMLNEANENWNRFASRSLHYPEKLTKVSEKLKKFYFGEASQINSTKFEQNFTNLFGDRLFIVVGAEVARVEAKFTPTYVYYYNYGSSYNMGEFIASAHATGLPSWVNVLFYMTKRWVLEQLNLTPKNSGHACHSDEISMLFHRNFFEMISKSHPDYAMSSDLVKLWTSFANDEPVLRFRNTEWQPASDSSGSGGFKYLEINENPAMIEEPFEQRRLFWKQLNLPDL